MAKDPAFLFYSQDFLTGTMFFNDAQTGIYIKLLCAQHQLGGIIAKDSFNAVVGDNNIIRSKFIETDDGFFNQRLMEEMEKRSIKSTNLSANAKVRWDKHKEAIQSKCKSNAKASAKHMPIEDEIENEDVNKIEVKKEILRGRARKFKAEVYSFTEYPPEMLKEFFQYWIEPNKSFTKMRYELQKTWELKLRLIKWASNQKDFKKQEANSHVMPSKNIGGSNYSTTKRNSKEPALLGIILDKAKELNIN